MSSVKKTLSGLDEKFQKVLQTPASFDFFVAIHNFIEYIELNRSLSVGLSPRLKANRKLDILNEYSYLKQIYQGVEDINTKSNSDLGHARYSAIRDLNKIRINDVSESNYFWKKRELSRKSTGKIYQRLAERLLGSAKSK